MVGHEFGHNKIWIIVKTHVFTTGGSNKTMANQRIFNEEQQQLPDMSTGFETVSKQLKTLEQKHYKRKLKIVKKPKEPQQLQQ